MNGQLTTNQDNAFARYGDQVAGPVGDFIMFKEGHYTYGQDAKTDCAPTARLGRDFVKSVQRVADRSSPATAATGRAPARLARPCAQPQRQPHRRRSWHQPAPA